MALRGWRLFGVAGTICVYVTGILLLSLMSIQHPEQRRVRRVYQEADPLRHHELGIINRKPPLQWCTKLHYLDSISSRTIQPISAYNRLQTFPGHYIKSRQSSPYHSSIYNRNIHSTNKLGDINVNNHNNNNNNNNNNIVHGAQSSSDLNLSSYADKQKSAGGRGGDDQRQYQEINENYRVVTEPWPSGDGKLKSFINHYNLATNKLVETSNSDNGAALTALVSFPGSGNTWLRYLLQQATGILTGSVYKDYGLLKSGFPAESISNSSVLVIKTHEWGPNAWTPFSRAILLVRDPKKAILAEFNRQSGGHVGFASPDRYKRTKGRYWNQFVTNKLWAWEQTNLAWAKNFTGNTLIVYYDKLVDDVEGTLRSILKFIEFPIDEELLSCALMRQEGIYRRKKRIMPFDPYTPAMHAIIDEKRSEVYAVLGRKT